MVSIEFDSPCFQDESEARFYLEKVRWPNGPVCPHCGSTEEHYAIKGKSVRPGLWKCKKCRKQFSVTVGTVFESSHIPLNKWLYAAFLLCSSKKGMSVHQLHRMIEVTYKTAWFMFHRLRHAMDQEPGQPKGTIEADETYVEVRGAESAAEMPRKKSPFLPLSKETVTGFLCRLKE